MVARSQMNAEGLLTNEKFLGETFGAPHTVDPSKYCVGEKLTSLYQFVKSAIPTFLGTTSTFSNNYLVTSPMAIGMDVLQTTTAVMQNQKTYASSPASNNETIPDHYAYITPCFAFSRGGMRFKAFQAGAGTTANLVFSLAKRLDSSASPWTGNFGTNGLTGQTPTWLVKNQSFGGGSEVQIPNYARSFVRSTPNLLS